MKQILQNLGNGETMLADVPCPARGAGQVLIGSTRSLVSLGTEKMLVDFGRKGWIAKARSQPDKVKQVLQKIKTDGLWATIEAVRDKLDQPIPLGYCNVGRVLECDSTGPFQVHQRVVSNGHHAEVVAVPNSLVAAIPDNVDDEAASFVVVAAIGLQGIRLLNPTLGERVAVFGLGLIGLLTVQMLRANGCQVLGIDLDSNKLELARKFGAATVDLSAGQDPVATAAAWTGGAGVDGVIITASTKSDELVHQAATMCRKRGRVILVGVIGLNLRRSDFYEKELTFQVSCSYGPGRYDPNFEQRGLDYPLGFVRWTEQRNFEAVLQLMSRGALQTADLVTHRFRFDDALSAYEVVQSGRAMGIVLEYDPIQPDSAQRNRNVSTNVGAIRSSGSASVGIGMIGAGGFSTRMILPNLKKLPVSLRTVVSKTGVSGSHAARKFGFAQSSTDMESVLSDPSVQAVFITTPHRSHGSLTQKVLAAGKHAFVEKPLALTSEEIDAIEQVLREQSSNGLSPLLMVGFNRRFSPHIQQMKKWLASMIEPRSIVMTVNAGAIPADHWTQDVEVGGGRIAGEACHFIDLARFLSDAAITGSSITYLGGAAGRLRDSAVIQLTFADGSIASINYLATGDKGFPKERIEVFAGGKVLVCDNFRRTYAYGLRGGVRTSAQDKGHPAELAAFIRAIQQGGEWPIPLEQMIEVSRLSIELAAVPNS